MADSTMPSGLSAADQAAWQNGTLLQQNQAAQGVYVPPTGVGLTQDQLTSIQSQYAQNGPTSISAPTGTGESSGGVQENVFSVPGMPVGVTAGPGGTWLVNAGGLQTTYDSNGNYLGVQQIANNNISALQGALMVGTAALGGAFADGTLGAGASDVAATNAANDAASIDTANSVAANTGLANTGAATGAGTAAGTGSATTGLTTGAGEGSAGVASGLTPTSSGAGSYGLTSAGGAGTGLGSGTSLGSGLSLSTATSPASIAAQSAADSAGMGGAAGLGTTLTGGTGATLAGDLGGTLADTAAATQAAVEAAAPGVASAAAANGALPTLSQVAQGAGIAKTVAGIINGTGTGTSTGTGGTSALTNAAQSAALNAGTTGTYTPMKFLSPGDFTVGAGSTKAGSELQQSLPELYQGLNGVRGYKKGGEVKAVPGSSPLTGLYDQLATVSAQTGWSIPALLLKLQRSAPAKPPVFRTGGDNHVKGAGGGQDDLIDAKLADGEYVFDADIVSALGDGSNKEGAKKLDEMREAIRAHKRSAPNDKIPPKAKSPLSYLNKR